MRANRISMRIGYRGNIHVIYLSLNAGVQASVKGCAVMFCQACAMSELFVVLLGSVASKIEIKQAKSFQYRPRRLTGFAMFLLCV